MMLIYSCIVFERNSEYVCETNETSKDRAVIDETVSGSIVVSDSECLIVVDVFIVRDGHKE